MRLAVLGTKGLSPMKVKTNNQHRPIIYGYELPPKARAEFDYYESEDELNEACFFQYKGEFWDIGQFIRQSGPSWDGCHALTAFSGILIKFVDNYDAVIVAYCHW